MNIELHAGRAGTDNIERAMAGFQQGSEAAHQVRFPQGLRFEGDATFPCNVPIEGEVSGTLQIAEGCLLLVAPTGKASGTFCAGDARVEGQMVGEIDCSRGSVEFAASAKCEVKVLYRELSVARGAQVEADLQRVGGANG